MEFPFEVVMEVAVELNTDILGQFKAEDPIDAIPNDVRCPPPNVLRIGLNPNIGGGLGDIVIVDDGLPEEHTLSALLKCADAPEELWKKS